MKITYLILFKLIILINISININTLKIVKVEEVKVEVKAEAKEDLSTHTIAELKAMCKERNLKGYSILKKDELIALLNA